MAAALPGNDPLAAALAAGRRPRPRWWRRPGKKKAAPGDRVGVFGADADRTCRDGAALEQDRGHQHGADAHVGGSARREGARPDADSGLRRAGGYVICIRKKPGLLELHKGSRPEQKSLGAIEVGISPVVVFWYRESPQYMANKLFTWVAIAEPDAPPLQLSGMVQEFFSPDGRLTEFTAVPPQLDTSTDPAPAPDWGPLFAAAGLDAKNFMPRRRSGLRWWPATRAKRGWEPGRAILICRCVWRPRRFAAKWCF